jgi:ATP-dependent helicase/nuclease subunit A
VKVRLITASAGSGKTWRLTNELYKAIAEGRARAEGIVATTFTIQAAAELIERARARLLQVGRARDANELLASRIGTVNSVCGSFVAEYAFELGLSPAMRVLDDADAGVEFRRALARSVSEDCAAELESFKSKFDPERDWRVEVRQIVDAARANGLGVAQLLACAARSIHELDACLPAVTTDDLDRALADAIAVSVSSIEANDDDTKGTAAYLEKLRRSANDLARSRRLSWGAWASLAKDGPTKRSRMHAVDVQQIACRHVEHPRLRADLHRLITLQFEAAAGGLAAYQEHKRVQGVIDFVDQETLALQLLRRSDIRAALAGQIQLFLVDEFQDTSPVQLAVFLEIARLATESVWVGDPKQAIFGFRGTDPSLMDVAVESLASSTSDPELIEQAAHVLGNDNIETLGISYRSRPALVAVTSEIFARAFANHGMPEDRTRLVASLQHEPAGLGEIVEYWPLEIDRSAGTDNDDGRAAALATGVRDLFARAPNVRRGDGVAQVCRRDVAVLCRTNKQCQAVADALGALGVAAIVPRMGLLATAEARVVLAGLALWVDHGDALAAAELARIITHPSDLDAVVARVLAAPGREAFRDDPTVARLLAARAVNRDLGPIAAVDAVIAATQLRSLCAGWGDTAQRIANLDALRAHASTYARKAAATGVASTIVGLLRHFDALVPSFGGWTQTRADRQALLASEDAVVVSTWHGSKGLEWPITVLFGLETVPEPTSYGVHVISDRATFEIADPLGGRWIRYWPNPYNTRNQLGPVRDAFEQTAAHASLVAKADRETLRVLYVAWTRARDRLVLSAKRGHLLGGVAGRLASIDAALISEPTTITRGLEPVRWAGTDLTVAVVPCRPAPPIQISVTPGMITCGRPHESYVPARITPSSAPLVPCTLGEIVALGPRAEVAGDPDMERVGHSIHDFLAADRPGLDEEERRVLAADLLRSYAMEDHLDADDVVAMASRLWSWIERRFSGARIYREWPIAQRVHSGSVVAGTADLVLVGSTGVVVIDHKSFPGTAEAAAERALGYSGQLAAYAAALRAALGSEVSSTWIHFPVRGRIVEVKLAAPQEGLA